MKVIDIELEDRSYPIYISSTNQFVDRLEEKVQGDNVLIVSNTTIAPLYMDYVAGLLPNKRVETLVLDDGEIFKNNDSLQKIITKLLTLKYTRSATLIALGGGVIGDLVGFAASIYQRGIDFIQFPTSLLAQVDSSVGGKTAINHPLGKNMIGTFYQPKAVFINVDVLDTLPRREFISGLAEVIKYGLIRDQAFFYWLKDNKDAILMRDKNAIKELIARSCQNKKEIVSAGSFVNNPELSVVLNYRNKPRLIWDKNNWYLHLFMPIGKAPNLFIEAEWPLSNIKKAFINNLGINETADIVLCVPAKNNRANCFPTRLSKKPFGIPRILKGSALPIDYALSGKKGVMIGYDHRYEEVLAAYSPVGTLGLGMVLKIDIKEIYKPAMESLAIVFPLLGLAILIGIVILRLSIMP